MFTRVKTLVKNHWKKAAFGVGVQVAFYGVKYAAGKFLSYHEEQALELWKKIQKEQHFESMDSTFKSSFFGLADTFRETVVQCLDAETLQLQLKATDLGFTNKLELWEKLKIIGFSRIIVTIYGSSLLNILLRIQLSVIGGYLFLESNEGERKHEWRNVNGIILSNNTAIDTDLQQKYLSLASYLVKTGIQNLCTYVHEKTAAVVGSIGLKQKLTITDLEGIFLDIVRGINRDVAPIPYDSPVKYPWKYIFPDDVLQSHDYFRNAVQKCRPHYEPPDMYERLLTETFDLLDSDDVVGLLSSFERQGISHFCDRVADYVVQDSRQTIADTSSTANLHVFSEVEIPMAKVIPMLNGLVSQGINNTDPWLSVLSNSESSRTFAANVYESFSNSID